MSDQSVNPSGMEIIPKNKAVTQRNPDGTWPPGYVANPTGANGTQKGWQPIGQRYIHLGEKYTDEQIIELAEDPDARRREKLSYWDSFAVKRMARSIDRQMTVTESGSDQCLKESKEIIDRIEGTPVQTIRTPATPPITHEDLANVTPDRLNEILTRINAP